MNEEARSEPAALRPELCDRLLYYAWRAPSPHNAQGWRIEVDGERFRVSRDLARQVLRDFDPEGRESDLACGAVVTYLCVSARALGLDAEVLWQPADDAVADVTLRPASDGHMLVLRRHFIDELMKNDPSCAAEVLFGLARVLADRQYAPAS